MLFPDVLSDVLSGSSPPSYIVGGAFFCANDPNWLYAIPVYFWRSDKRIHKIPPLTISTVKEFFLVNTSIPVITIDGPSGVGKGTVTLRLAQYLGWHYLDSGAIYRVLALAAMQRQLTEQHPDSITQLAVELQVEFHSLPDLSGTQVLLEQHDVTSQLRTETIAQFASQLAAIPSVRSALLQRQRDCRRLPGLVADGRDMGTVVFPDAPLKFFLTASPQERANRRYKQLKQKGIDANLDNLVKEIAARDQRDCERQTAPLTPQPTHNVLTPRPFPSKP
jgi:CMP/dCMP kinase